VSTEQSGFVVVGAGLAGAATAWQLAAAGREVTVLERGVPADPAGSSHGSARIFRHAYPSELYTRLVRRSRALWSELESLAGTQLITPTGSLDFGTLRAPEELAAILERVGVEHELLDLDQAAARWPQFTFDSSVLWHPDAGVLDAQSAVGSMLDQARAHGASVVTGWDLRSISRAVRGFELASQDGRTVTAERVVVAAGGWLPRLLGSLGLPRAFLERVPHLEVRQEQAYHFPYLDDPPDPAAAAPWPTFIHKSEPIQTYGLPGGPDAGFRGQKVAEYNGGKVLPSAAEQDGTIDPANRERVVGYVRRHVPGVSPQPYAETTCLFTNTPTQDFVLDRCDGITVVSPCSGHGAKFAPLIGAYASAMAAASGDAAGRLFVPEDFLVGTA
jgi:sarcosine oxidase